jgi:imidazolonepropionase-like amidohydrolase
MTTRLLLAAAAAFATTVAGAAPLKPAQLPGGDPYPSTYRAIPSPATLFRHATVLTGTGARLDDADLLLVGGRVQAVGQGLEAPAGAVVVDATGKWITPGIIDVHSHLGVYPSPGVQAHEDGNEMTSPVTPNVWAEHALWPQDPGFAAALAGGVTVMQVLPGSGNLIGGRGVTIKNVPATTYQAMKFPGAPWGLKMACGENPKRVYGGKGNAPMTRMGNVAGYRAAFLEAQAYAREWNKYMAGEAPATPLEDASNGAATQPAQVAPPAQPADPSRPEIAVAPETSAPTVGTEATGSALAGTDVAPPKKKRRWFRRDDAGRGEAKAGDPPERDLANDTLMGAMQGKIRVHIHCYRADEMAIMLDLAKEFGFRVAAFHHGVEAYKIADRLAAEGVCGALWADWWGFKMEAFDGIEENLALVDRPARGCAIVHSDSAEGIQRLNQEAAKAMAHAHRVGIEIPPERAIRWLTANPARALGIDRRTGTLEAGKMGDVVVWNGTPFSVYAHAEQVYVDGARVFDRADKARQPRSDFLLGLGVSP